MFSAGQSSLYFAPKTKEKMYFIWLSMYLARKYYLREPFLHLVQEIGPPSYVAIRSPHVTEIEFRNPRNFCLWNPESWALKSGIHLKESRIPLTFGIQNSSSTCSPECTAWNPESTIYKWKIFPQLRGASSSHTSVWKTKAVPLYLLLTLSFLLLLSRKRLSRSWV